MIDWNDERIKRRYWKFDETKTIESIYEEVNRFIIENKISKIISLSDNLDYTIYDDWGTLTSGNHSGGLFLTYYEPSPDDTTNEFPQFPNIEKKEPSNSGCLVNLILLIIFMFIVPLLPIIFLFLLIS